MNITTTIQRKFYKEWKDTRLEKISFQRTFNHMFNYVVNNYPTMSIQQFAKLVQMSLDIEREEK